MSFLTDIVVHTYAHTVNVLKCKTKIFSYEQKEYERVERKSEKVHKINLVNVLCNS